MAGDEGRGLRPLGTINMAPNPNRLDFLVEGPGCYRDARWIDPLYSDYASGKWTADRPFHIRESFINNRAEPLGEGFDVVVYVTRVVEGSVEPTYRYTSDALLRGISDRCGPTYGTQTEPQGSNSASPILVRNPTG